MASHMGPARQKSRAPLAIVIVIVVLVAVGGALWWFLLRPRAQAPSQDAGQQAATAKNEGSATNTATSSSDESESGWDDTSLEATNPNARLKAMLDAGEVRSIRLIGDSITEGVGTDGHVDPFVENTGVVIFDDGQGNVHYEATTAADDWANSFRSYAAQRGVKSFVNAGIGGAFMHELAENPDAWIREGADVIFVALGTNDAGYYGTGEYRQDARVALAAAAKKAKLVVGVAPVSDLRDTEMLVEPASALGDVLAQVCAEGGYAFVDARDVSSPAQFIDDSLHPNSAGSQAIWSCIRRDLGL